MTLYTLDSSLIFHPIDEDYSTALFTMFKSFAQNRTFHISSTPVIMPIKYISTVNYIGIKFTRFIGALDSQIVVSKTQFCE